MESFNLTSIKKKPKFERAFSTLSRFSYSWRTQWTEQRKYFYIMIIRMVNINMIFLKLCLITFYIIYKFVN